MHLKSSMIVEGSNGPPNVHITPQQKLQHCAATQSPASNNEPKICKRFVLVHQATGLQSVSENPISVAITTSEHTVCTNTKPACRFPLWNEVVSMEAPGGDLTIQVALQETYCDGSRSNLMEGELNLAADNTSSYRTRWIELYRSSDTVDANNVDDNARVPIGKVKITIASRLEDAQAMQRGLLPEASQPGRTSFTRLVNQETCEEEQLQKTSAWWKNVSCQ